MNYALNLVPHLQMPGVIALSQTASLADRSILNQTTFEVFEQIPPKMSADQGTQGHFRRLVWTQLQLSRLQRKLRSRLLFSPIPEAPLFSNCRYVVTAHDLIPLRFPRRSPLTFYCRYYIPQVLQQAQHIVCNSTATAEDLMRFFGISAHRITPILLAHDADHFQFRNLPTCPYFLYVGRNDPHKNLPRLIAAFATLPDRDLELWLVGTTDRHLDPVLLTQAAELGIVDRLKILDYVPYAELPILLNQAIALVFPSLWEGFGLPVLEAMACGTPVITSNLASLPEVAGDAAILVNPYSVLDIAAAMQTVLQAEVRSQLRSAGLARASQFSWAKTGKQTADILQQYA